MAGILCVGNAVLDLVFGVPRHPGADEELRAQTLRVGAGGNAANTARVLRALGHDAALAAVLSDHPLGALVEEDLRRAGVDLGPCRRAAGPPPLSAVLLPAQGGTRAIVHHRALPEYPFEDFARLDLSRWRWAHFEARPGEATARMVRHARVFQPGLLISIEMEKPRPEAQECLREARLVLFSRNYADRSGAGRPDSFLRATRERIPHALLAVAWGDQGAWGMEADGTLHHAPAVPPALVVDTLGAGDAFNAGMISALASGRSLPAALAEGCGLAGRKVGREGLSGIAP